MPEQQEWDERARQAASRLTAGLDAGPPPLHETLLRARGRQARRTAIVLGCATIVLLGAGIPALLAAARPAGETSDRALAAPRLAGGWVLGTPTHSVKLGGRPTSTAQPSVFPSQSPSGPSPAPTQTTPHPRGGWTAAIKGNRLVLRNPASGAVVTERIFATGPGGFLVYEEPHQRVHGFGCAAPGTYAYRSGSEKIRLRVVDDHCRGRVLVLTAGDWRSAALPQ